MGKAAVAPSATGDAPVAVTHWSGVKGLRPRCLVAGLTFGTSPWKKIPAGNMGYTIRRIRLWEKKQSNSVTASVCQCCVLGPRGLC